MSRRFDGEQTPAILYKYLTVERAKTVLLDSKVFFACPADFNDPFDCSLPMDFSPRGDVRRRFLRRLVREREPSVPRWLRVAKVRDVLREHPEIFEPPTRTSSEMTCVMLESCASRNRTTTSLCGLTMRTNIRAFAWASRFIRLSRISLFRTARQWAFSGMLWRLITRNPSHF